MRRLGSENEGPRWTAAGEVGSGCRVAKGQTWKVWTVGERERRGKVRKEERIVWCRMEIGRRRRHVEISANEEMKCDLFPAPRHVEIPIG